MEMNQAIDPSLIEEVEKLLPKDDELHNLVPKLASTEEGLAELKKLGSDLILAFDEDNASRSTWLTNLASDLKLFAAFVEAKNHPWKGASNVILPFLSIATIQYQARAFEALIPSREIVNVIDPGGNDSARASRVKEHMNYQLLFQMEEFGEGMDKTLFQQPLAGCVFRATYFCPERQRNVSEYISAEDMVVAYGSKLSIEEVRRKSRILRVPIDKVKRRQLSGFYVPTKEPITTGNSNSVNLDTPITDEVDKITGVEKPTLSSIDNYRVFIEIHTYFNFTNDPQGFENPCIITIDYETRQIVRLTTRVYRTVFGELREIEHFTKYGFFPNPEGFYDLGFGTLLRGLNHAADTIVNQVIDAGYLANVGNQSGFVSKRSGLKKNALSLTMGKFTEVDMNADDIKKAIYTFDFKGPNETLYAVLGLLYEYSKLVSSVSETMVGNMPSSDTPATTIMALIEEGKKVFSSIHKRNHRNFKKELNKLFRLNSIFLNDQEYFRILDKQNIPTGEVLVVGRLDYLDDFGVFPVSDPNMMSRSEQVLLAKEVYSTVLTSPLTANNPEAIYEAQYRYFKALGVPDIEKVLQAPVPQDLSPEDENANFLTSKPGTVLPQQDDMYHLVKHMELEQGPFAKSLKPEAVQMLDQHKAAHTAQLYKKEEIRKAQEANSQALIASQKAGQLK